VISESVAFGRLRPSLSLCFAPQRYNIDVPFSKFFSNYFNISLYCSFKNLFSTKNKGAPEDVVQRYIIYKGTRTSYIYWRNHCAAPSSRMLRASPEAYKADSRNYAKMLSELPEHPETGLAHPEALSGSDGITWPRHVTAHDRIACDIHEDTIQVCVNRGDSTMTNKRRRRFQFSSWVSSRRYARPRSETICTGHPLSESVCLSRLMRV
jgi:Txe/YoeB family toxin of Txe-Axe toxin-antitoxin module